MPERSSARLTGGIAGRVQSTDGSYDPGPSTDIPHAEDPE